MIEQALAIAHNFRPQDIFDIAIVAIMISTLLIWFKDRASRFVFLGLALIAAIYLLARFFQLYLTTVILQGFFAILLFVLVVIFQEDLRRIFERIALLGRIRRRLPPSPPFEETAEILSQTVAALTRKKVGALIVLQGEDPLDRHLNGGTPLDGLVSQSLLESIFDPHSIGHDGAVVIEGNRLVRFGCHLPLSSNIGQYGNLGLRHTAALGLAERCDALCIVVSEERGAISLARNERLETVANASLLQTALEAFYARKAPARASGPVRRWLRENPREKILALLLACILWFFFGYQRESVQRDFTIPIEYQNMPAQWVVEEPRVTAAKVLLKGPPQAFQLLNEGNLKIVLDLSRLQEGRQDFLLTREMVRAPSTLSVTSLKPSRVEVVASRLSPVTLPVEAVTVGELPAGYALQQIIVTPPTIRVLVPGRLRSSLTKIRTEPVDLSGLEATTVVEAKLLSPPEVQFKDGRPPTARLMFKIHKKK